MSLLTFINTIPKKTHSKITLELVSNFDDSIENKVSHCHLKINNVKCIKILYLKLRTLSIQKLFGLNCHLYFQKIFLKLEQSAKGQYL